MKAKLINYTGDCPDDVIIGKVYEVVCSSFLGYGGCYSIIDDKQDEHIIDKSCFETVNELTKQSSDGGSTSYYQLPEGATELFDLINHRNMNFSVGNIFKACYRMGEKEGIDDIYDLKKIIFMAEQELKRLGHKPD